MSQKIDNKIKKIDDWEYNSTREFISKKHSRGPMSIVTSSPTIKSLKVSNTLGFSVGGAKDADNFYENIKNNYLPKIDSITYEGVFYDHYFNFNTEKKDKCNTLFCPTYSTAVENNLFSSEKEYFLSVGLDSNIKESDFKRKKLNLIVVLDISGSMSSPFNQYYYDRNRKIELKENKKVSKIKIANKTIVSMIDHLKDDDQFGVILFDNNAYRAKPLRKIKNTNIKAIKKHILELKPRGGTNWSAGYKEALKLFDTLKERLKNPAEYENRIIFLTDAMPNMGELKEEKLFGLVKKASKQKIYTSFIGIGVDFNNDLVEYISKTKGANYYSVHSSDEFKKRLDDEFDYMVTPMVFDLKLKLKTDSYKITAIYGSPDAKTSTGDIMYINTLFPSKSSQNGVKGGVVLLRLEKIDTKKSSDLLLELTYKDSDENSYKIDKKITINSNIHYDNSGIQKAILLSHYVDLIKNYIIDTRKSCNDKVQNTIIQPIREKCISYPPNRKEFNYIKTWERKSCPLQVSDGYKKIFLLFKRYFQTQMNELNDKSLQKELNLLETLISKNSNILKQDDWQIER